VDAIKAALSSDDVRVRRGATRIFLRYFYHLVDRKDIAQQLCALTQDTDPLVRIHALQSLWRWWYRTTDFALRRQIEQAFLRLAANEREPLVRLNIAQALHNILDENTVQFFNNWLRVVHLDADKEKAKQVRIEFVERPLAKEIADALRACDDVGKETILTAFSYFYLRGGVGNDYDFITFYDQQAAQTLADALLPLLDHPDPVMRLKATKTAVAVRLSKDVRLVTKLMERLKDSDGEVRRAALLALQHPAFPTDYRSAPATVAQRQ
jgi:HEAT repeat protein